MRVDDVAVLIQPCICRGYVVLLFLIRSQVVDLVRDTTIDYSPVWRFYEAKFVHPSLNRKGSNQTDIRPLWCLNGTNSAVVRMMNVPDFQFRALPTKAPWAQCTEFALVRKFSQRIRLVHELRQLTTSEEALDTCRDGLN